VSELTPRLLLTETVWRQLDESTQQYLVEWHRDVTPLLEEYCAIYEADLTPDQIQSIFQNAEQYAVDSKKYMTKLGKAGDTARVSAQAAKKLNDKINELAKKAQNTAPVENFDQKFEQLKSDIANKLGGDSSKIVAAANKLGQAAKDNPTAATFIVGLLTVAGAVAGGPLGGAGVGFLMRAGKDVLTGEKLSTAAGRATKVGALGALAGAGIEAISNAFPGAPVTDVTVSDSGSVELPDRYTINGEEVSAEEYQQWKQDNPVFSDREMREFDQLAQKGETINRMAEQMGVDNAGNNNAKMIGNVPVEINGEPVPAELYTEEQKQSLSAARQARAAMGISDSIDYELLLIKRNSGIALTEAEQQVVNEFGWSDVKKVASNIKDKTTQAAKGAGREAGQKITARKLQKLWTEAGSPTDSDEIAQVLAKAGLDDKGIQAVGNGAGVELPAVSGISQTSSNQSSSDDTADSGRTKSRDEERLERLKKARSSAGLNDNEESEPEPETQAKSEVAFPGTDIDFEKAWVKADDLTAADSKVADVLDKVASGVDPSELSMQELLAARRKLNIKKPKAATESLRQVLNKKLKL
jgi:ribosomal protein L12E/L44/L45/RPP1/RPP2